MKQLLSILMLAGFTSAGTLVPSLGRSTFGIPPVTARRNSSASRWVPPVDHQAQEEWFYGQRAAPRQTIPPNAWVRAYQQRTRVQAYAPPTADTASTAFELTGPWTPIGPAPTGTTNPTSGRVSALAYDAVNNIVYAGAADGGLWKSPNGGTTWTPLTDNQPSLAVGSIALDPSNPQIIYVGTGEENVNPDSYYSAGVLKSTDGGSTWTQMGASTFATNHNTHIGTMAVDPNNTAHVLAATDQGLFLSTDGGSSWTNVLGHLTTDLIVDPSTAPSTVYAAAGRPAGDAANGIYKSVDGGSTWTLLAGAPSGTGIGRVAIAQAPSNPHQLYLVASSPAPDFGRSLGMWASSDDGTTWTQVAPAWASGGPDLLGTQGFYDIYVAVDPTSASTVYVGGITVWKTTDGGRTFSSLAGSIHSDQHALVFYGSGVPRAFYIGNDGGVYGSSDGGQTFTDNNGNLAITQFYAGATTANFPANRVVYGGTQDNGTQKYTGNPVWAQVLDSDGGYPATDPTSPDTAYAQCQGLCLYKTTDGGTSWAPAMTGIDPSQYRLFLMRLVMDPSDPSHLLVGTDHLYETTNGAGLWTQISPSLASSPFDEFGAVSAIAIAPSAPTTTFYAGAGDGKISVTMNDGLDWTDITAGTVGTSGRFVTSLAVNPANAQDVVVTFSGFTNGSGGHVYRSTNGGASWTDISAGLPDSPVTSILRDPRDANTLFIGADDGFFFTTDGGSTWSQYQTGLPNAGIDQLFSDTDFTTLIAATHGRGMFTLSLSVPQATIVTSPTEGSPFQTITLTGTTFGASEAVKVYWDRWGSIGTTPLVTATTTAGSFVVHVTVPQAKGGMHTLIAVGQTSRAMATASFGVKPAVFLFPASGTTGSVASLMGVGFGASEAVVGLWYPGFKLLNAADSNTVGTAVMPFVVPACVPRTCYVIGYGVSSKTYAFSPFTVSAAATTTPPEATLRPPGGPPLPPPYPLIRQSRNH